MTNKIITKATLISVALALTISVASADEPCASCAGGAVSQAVGAAVGQKLGGVAGAGAGAYAGEKAHQFGHRNGKKMYKEYQKANKTHRRVTGKNLLRPGPK